MCLVLRQIDFVQLLDLLKKINIVYFVLAILALLVDYCLAAYRWKYILSDVKKCRYFNLLRATYVGRFYNILFPARLGEFAKFMDLSRKEKLSAGSIMSSIVVEHVLDLIAIVTLTLFVCIYFPLSEKLQMILLLLILTIVLMSLFFILLAKKTDILKRVVLQNFSEKISKTYIDILEGLNMLSSKKKFLFLLIISVFSWSFNASVYYFIARSLGLELSSAFVSALYIAVFITLATAVPFTPAHLGVYEYVGLMATLRVSSATYTEGIAFVLICHALHMLTPMLIASGFILSRRRLDRELNIHI